jgi:hypothetical protein
VDAESETEPPPDATRWSRADLTLARRAARERWGVPDALRTEALFQCARILADPLSDARHALAAGRLLATLTRCDQLDDRLDLERARVTPDRPPDARDALLSEAERIVDGSLRMPGGG